MPRALLRAAVLAAIACGGTAHARIDAIDMSLEKLLEVRVLSTPKFAENADEIPSVVSILTREEIRLYGWRTLADALRSLQGFNVTNDHTYHYAGVRGISPPGDYRPRLQVLIDGLAVNENIYSSAPVSSDFPLDLDLIDRIEVVRGPSAAVYGGDAMFGVINVVTRGGASIGGAEAAASAGSGRDYRGRISGGGQVLGADVAVSVTGFDARGVGLNLGGVQAPGDSWRADRIGGESGSQAFARARGNDWRLAAIYSERERVVTTGSYGTIFNDAGHREKDTYAVAEFAKDWRLDGRSILQQRLYVGQYRYDADFPYDYSPDIARLLNRDRARGGWWGLDNRLVVNQGEHRWTAGADFRAETRQWQYNEDVGYGCYGQGAAPCLDDHRDGRQITAYVQDELRVGDAGLLTAGLRYDRTADFGGFWSPRLGYVHDAGGAGLFKALYGSAFRIPSVYERFYATSSYSYGNASLASEKMQSIEFAWERRLGSSARVTAALYAFNVDRMVSADLDNIATNGDKVHARGIELEYESRLGGGGRLRAGYAGQRAATDDGRMDNSPRHMAKVNLALPAGMPGLMAGLEGQWVGERLAFGGREKVAAYGVANLNLTYAPGGAPWDLAIGVYNLFDRRYEDPVATDDLTTLPRWSMPQTGRQYRLKATFRF